MIAKNVANKDFKREKYKGEYERVLRYGKGF